jgi:hypothetical protein
VQRAAVFEQDLHAPVGGAQAIAAQERHVERGCFRASFALERGGPFDERDVRGRVVLRFLRRFLSVDRDGQGAERRNAEKRQKAAEHDGDL